MFTLFSPLCFHQFYIYRNAWVSQPSGSTDNSKSLSLDPATYVSEQ